MHFFRHSRLVSAVPAAVLFFCLTVLFTGCEQSNLFGYTAGAADFTLLFPSVSGDAEFVSCTCRRDENGDFSLTVTSPDRLAGFAVRISGGVTSAGMGDTVIPLSADAARGLTSLLAVLTEEGIPARSEDGTETVISAPSGTLILDETLTPAEITANGRSVKITGWKQDNFP